MGEGVCGCVLASCVWGGLVLRAHTRCRRAPHPRAPAPRAPQTLRIENSQHGVKPLAVRLKLVFTPAGAAEAVVEQTDVKSFPPGF